MQSAILPPSNVRPIGSTQKRLARRLANYTYSIACAIRWRNRSFNHYDGPEVRAIARVNMRESALRAGYWRNLMVRDADGY